MGKVEQHPSCNEATVAQDRGRQISDEEFFSCFAEAQKPGRCCAVHKTFKGCKTLVFSPLEVWTLPFVSDLRPLNFLSRRRANLNMEHPDELLILLINELPSLGYKRNDRLFLF